MDDRRGGQRRSRAAQCRLHIVRCDAARRPKNNWGGASAGRTLGQDVERSSAHSRLSTCSTPRGSSPMRQSHLSAAGAPSAQLPGMHGADAWMLTPPDDQIVPCGATSPRAGVAAGQYRISFARRIAVGRARGGAAARRAGRERASVKEFYRSCGARTLTGLIAPQKATRGRLRCWGRRSKRTARASRKSIPHSKPFISRRA